MGADMEHALGWPGEVRARGEELSKGDSRPCSRSLGEHGPRSCYLSGLGGEQSDSGVRETNLGLNCYPQAACPLTLEYLSSQPRFPRLHNTTTITVK